MSATGDNPILDVKVMNWPDPKDAKPVNCVYSTSVKTYILDPAALTVDQGRRYQIADYEPNRVRMTVRAVDAAIAMTLEVPINSPDVSSATAAQQGLYLPPNTTGPAEEFFGPDAWWINALATVTRVCVVKEYTR